MIHRYAIPVILACALGAIGSLPVVAQEEDRIAQLEERIVETRKRMNLSDEQVEQITPLMEAHIESIATALDKHGINFQDRSGERKRLNFREMRALRKDLDAVRADTADKLSAILDESQIKEYKKIQAERKVALRERIRERYKQR